MVTTRDVITGDLLLVAPPLAFVEASLGSAPDTEDLFGSMVEEQWSAQQRRLLALMYDGSEASMAQGAVLADMAADGEAQGEAPAVDYERMRRVVESCAYGDDFQDPGTMQVGGREGGGTAGCLSCTTPVAGLAADLAGLGDVCGSWSTCGLCTVAGPGQGQWPAMRSAACLANALLLLGRSLPACAVSPHTPPGSCNTAVAATRLQPLPAASRGSL